MSNTYRVGIIGCGSIARSHVDGYRRVEEVEVVAVADPHPAAREQFREAFGIGEAYATYEEMLAGEALDLVSVCTWHLLHPAPTVASAEAGVKGIICEKPMAIGVGEADRMLGACEAHGTKLVIGHQRRFTPGWEKGRELVGQRAVGAPVMLTGRVRDGLTNWGTHVIDGMRFVLGDPETEWVMGALERRTDRYERDTAIEDCCMGLVTFAGGAQALIQSDLVTEGASAGVFQVRGTEGLLEVSEGRVRLFNASSGGWEEAPLESEGEVVGPPNAAQTRELIAWIEGGPKHRGSGRKARATVEVMMAIYESARQHGVVRMPLEETDYPLDLMIAEGKLQVEAEGRYDIRDFLRRDRIDEAAYARLKDEGLAHHAIMRRLGGDRGQ